MAEITAEMIPVTQGNIQLEQTNQYTGVIENCKISNDGNCNSNNSGEDEISPLQKTAEVDVSSTSSHTRKRSVLKKEDRPRVPRTEQKRVSFSSGPSERRVSNGESSVVLFFSVQSLALWKQYLSDSWNSSYFTSNRKKSLNWK